MRAAFLTRHSLAVRSRATRMDSIPGILLGLSDSTARSSVNSPHEFCSFYRNDLSFQTKRLFSSDAHQVLSDILTREYEEELENEASSGALPPDLESLKKALEVDWKIVTDGAMTKLYRTLSSTSPPSKVQVSFHCQDTVAVVSELDEVEYGGSETEDYEEEAEPVRFTVTVSRAGKVLVFTCLSEFAMPKIQGVAVATSEDVEAIHGTKRSPSAGGGSGGVDAYQYQGPEFEELAEDLKDAFHTYLEEEVGISEDMASFISMYSDFCEQIEYVGFLEDAKNIVQG